jgi:hypothetical protein
MMQNFLNKPVPTIPATAETTETHNDLEAAHENPIGTSTVVFGYLSDLSDDDTLDMDDEIDASDEMESTEDEQPRKRVRRKLEVSVQKAHELAHKSRKKELQQALSDIEKVIRSRCTDFQAGRNGLQAYRAQAIQSYFQMVVNNGCKSIDASEIAAESQGFSKKWGGRLVRSWVRDWIKHQELPSSSRGCHVKVYSLLEDPEICTKLRSYLRSNKWSMNPQKLAEFSKNQLILGEAEKYLRRIVEKEMPRGLKQYMEVELFPRIHLKVGKGISISTARRWLHREGFQYMEHKKALYFDGHDRPDVVSYRQKEFLPAMEKYRERLLGYKVGEVETKIGGPPNFVERILVLLAHDESTMQANDGPKAGWVLEGEQPLKKKGAGRGLHQSDVICSTVGWLSEASQTLEYGKNYDGYWTGELFVKQVYLFLLGKTIF